MDVLREERPHQQSDLSPSRYGEALPVDDRRQCGDGRGDQGGDSMGCSLCASLDKIDTARFETWV